MATFLFRTKMKLASRPGLFLVGEITGGTIRPGMVVNTGTGRLVTGAPILGSSSWTTRGARSQVALHVAPVAPTDEEEVEALRDGDVIEVVEPADAVKAACDEHESRSPPRLRGVECESVDAIEFDESPDRQYRCSMAARLKLGDAEIGTIYDLLDLIQVRPGMWIGAPSITRLAIFIEGFRCGVHAAHESLEAETPPFQDFHDWIAARLGRRKDGHGWSDMLLDSTGGNEHAAFEKFWNELDAFRAG